MHNYVMLAQSLWATIWAYLHFFIGLLKVSITKFWAPFDVYFLYYYRKVYKVYSFILKKKVHKENNK